MTTADDVPRPDPPHHDGERATLTGFLDYQRATVLRKVAGLTDEQARRVLLPSPLMTAAGVVNHLRWVEYSWLDNRMLGEPDLGPWTDEDPDREFTVALEMPLAQVVEEYAAQCRRSREIVASLDLATSTTVPTSKGDTFSLRWVVTHLIEETARHNGHLDLIRELTDGATGE